jgi:hypothetical protein
MTMQEIPVARTVNQELVRKYADQLRPLLPLAGKAYGTQRPSSPARLASDQVNEIILDYVSKGGNMTHLANELGPEAISLPGLRRRLRSARGGTLGKPNRKRGSKDPEQVEAAARLISQAKGTGISAEYANAVRQVYAQGISLSAVAEKMGIAYYSLWSAASHNPDLVKAG